MLNKFKEFQNSKFIGIVDKISEKYTKVDQLMVILLCNVGVLYFFSLNLVDYSTISWLLNQLFNKWLLINKKYSVDYSILLIRKSTMLINDYSTIIHILTSYKTPPLQIILTLPKGSNGTVPFQKKPHKQIWLISSLHWIAMKSFIFQN